MDNMERVALKDRHCRPCRGGMSPMSDDEVARHLAMTPAWRREGLGIVRAFAFTNYDQTVAFVHAVTEIARREDHHPEIAFGYRTCTVRYHTHAAGGLTENDFICAAKINEAAAGAH